VQTDGTVTAEHGYDRTSRLFYWPRPGLEIPPIPVTPDAAAIGRAVAILGDVLQDFPFVDAASRANMIALMVRRARP
jgi:hypothetical protein